MYCHEDNSEDGMIEWYSEWFVRRSEVFSSLADTLEQAIEMFLRKANRSENAAA